MTARPLLLPSCTAKHPHFVGGDFGDIAVVSLAIVIGAVLGLSFDVDLLILGQVLAANFGKLSLCHDVMPFGSILLLPLLIFEMLGRCQREGADRCPRSGK